jgi:hypothetical protein
MSARRSPNTFHSTAHEPAAHITFITLRHRRARIHVRTFQLHHTSCTRSRQRTRRFPRSTLSRATHPSQARGTGRDRGGGVHDHAVPLRAGAVRAQRAAVGVGW